MVRTRKTGFTLIELLIVVVIIRRSNIISIIIRALSVDIIRRANNAIDFLLFKFPVSTIN